MLECTSVTFGMHDGVSSNVASVAMKMKYAVARSMSKSTVIQTQLWSRSPPAMLQIPAPTTQKAPSFHQGTPNTPVAPWFQNHWGRAL